MGLEDVMSQQRSAGLCSTALQCASGQQGLRRSAPSTRQLLRYMHIHICGVACGKRRIGAAREWQAGMWDNDLTTGMYKGRHLPNRSDQGVASGVVGQ